MHMTSSELETWLIFHQLQQEITCHNEYCLLYTSDAADE